MTWSTWGKLVFVSHCSQVSLVLKARIDEAFLLTRVAFVYEQEDFTEDYLDSLIVFE